MEAKLDTEFRILFTIVVITFLVIIVVGVLQYRKNLMDKRAFLYIFIPVLLLPSAIAMTYIIIPGNTLNIVARLSIAVIIEILALAQVYFISFPLYKALMPGVKEYFNGDENNKKLK